MHIQVINVYEKKVIVACRDEHRTPFRPPRSVPIRFDWSLVGIYEGVLSKLYIGIKQAEAIGRSSESVGL